MFEQTFLVDVPKRRDQSIALALAAQSIAVFAIALISLWGVQPIERGRTFAILPPRALSPASEVKEAAAHPLSRPSTLRVALLPPFRTPARVPTSIALAPLDAPPLAGPSDLSGAAPGIPGGLADMVTAPVPPVTPRRAPPSVRAPLRVSSSISQSQLVFGPKPGYPKLALTARIEGTVRLQATISREGAIENLHVLSGHPLLVNAALEAVKQWRYRPVMLNGDPVEVITEIAVNFTLR